MPSEPVNEPRSGPASGRTGKVYLVGAGPGDPELLTVRGRKVLERAECLLYDYLAPERLLDYAPADAERIYVGKKRAHHTKSQEEIEALLIDRARQGKTVVRLKGGDPFIFGRGGEEAEALADAGIPFEVVPGVTTPLGLAAYTGVPLTHREHTSAVTFVTGHNVEAIDWAKVGSAETVILFMGLVNFVDISREMIAKGRSPETPAMVVRWATRPDQQTITGTLADLPEKIVQQGLRPPATIVIGDVVSLHGKLDWFERLPLFGQKIVITRDRRQAGALREPLEELGAEVIDLPAIEIRPPEDSAPLNQAIAELASYDWLIFTSVNGVENFTRALDASATDLRALRAKICAIGPATRRAVEALHLKVDVMPKEYVAESLLEALCGRRSCRQADPAAARRSGARCGSGGARQAGCGGERRRSLPYPRPRNRGRAHPRGPGLQARLDHLHQFVHRSQHSPGRGRSRSSRWNQDRLHWSDHVGNRPVLRTRCRRRSRPAHHRRPDRGPTGGQDCRGAGVHPAGRFTFPIRVEFVRVGCARTHFRNP